MAIAQLPRWRFILFASVSSIVVLATWWTFPPAAEPPLVAVAWLFPEVDKVVALLLSLGFLLVLDLAILGLGTLPQRRLAQNCGIVRGLLIRFALGSIVLGLIILGLASLQLLDRAWLTAVVLVPAIVGLPATLRTLRTLPRPAVSSLEARLVALVGTAVLVNAVFDAFVPDFGWDAFVYHLAVPERYLFEGGVWASPFSFYSAFPHAIQMLSLPALVWPGLAFDGASVVQLIHLQFGVLTVVALMVAVSASSAKAGLMVAAVVLADPLLGWLSGVAYVDLAGCFFVVLATQSLTVWWRVPSNRKLVLASICAAAVVTIHYRFAILLPIFGALIWWRSRSKPTVRLAVFLATILLISMPWMVRNIVFFENPVSPLVQTVFHRSGDEMFHPVAVEQSIELAQRRGPGPSFSEFVMLPWRLFVGKRPDGAPLYMFQVGTSYLLGGLAFLLFRRRDDVVSSLFMAVSCGAVCLWFWSGAQESRYLFPFLVCSAVPGANALATLAGNHRFGRWLCGAVFALLMTNTHATTLRSLSWNWGYAIGGLSVETYQAQDPVVKVGETLRRALGPDDRLFLLFEGRAWFFRGLNFIPYHVNEGSPSLQLVHEAEGVAALDQKLRSLGITHVLVNRESMRRYPTVFVDDYTADEFERDLDKLDTLLSTSTSPYYEAGGIVVRRLDEV